MEDNFLTELLKKQAREGAPLDLLFANREGLVGDVMVGGCLGHSDHKILEFLIFWSELPPWHSRRQIWANLETWWTESLGRQF